MTEFTWPDLLTGLVRGDDLSRDAASWAMNEILTGNASVVQITGFAVALRAKGESVDELAGMSEAMLDLAAPISLVGHAVDVVGTGGDRANTVNVSTMAAITAAAAGAKVVKHGNRSASSACGTADVLEELGVRLDLPASEQQRVYDEVGIVFLFASAYHASLRHAAAARKGLGIATTFNLLGPLANPARPRAQAVGVADARAAGLIAGVMADRGSQGLVFHGGDGLDELTTTTTSTLWVIGDGRVVETELDPRDLGLPRATVGDLVGGGPEVNAAVVRDTFAGRTGPVRDIVALNAAAALLSFEGPDLATPIAEQLAPRLDTVREVLDDGRADQLLNRWIEATSRGVENTL